MIEFPEGEEPVGSDADFIDASGLSRDEWFHIDAAARAAQDPITHEIAEGYRVLAGYGGLKR